MSDPATARFVPFGTTHLATLALAAVLVLGLVMLVRARPRLDPALRWGLFVAIIALVAVELVRAARYGWLGWRTVLPLELCDASPSRTRLPIGSDAARSALRPFIAERRGVRRGRGAFPFAAGHSRRDVASA